MMRIRTAADLGAFIRERRTKLGMDQIALAMLSVKRWLLYPVASRKHAR